MLWLLSAIYGMVVCVRNFFHDHLLKAHRANIKVIAVGNLSTGGTGKTPFCLWLFQNMLDAGWHPALALRGYAAKRGVSDEGLLYVQRLGHKPIFVGADRRRSLRDMGSQGFDLAILDDAFQHRRVARDLDIVLLDATHLPWEDALLPLGLFREPESSLSRAHVLVLTRTDLVAMEKIQHCETHLRERHPHLLILRASAVVQGYFDGQGLPVDPAGGPYLLCSGIGRPGAFHALAEKSLLRIAGVLNYPDHHDYPQASLDAMISQARLLKAAAILTTEKDAVKLKDRLPYPVVVLKMAMELEGDGRDKLHALVRSRCGGPGVEHM